MLEKNAGANVAPSQVPAKTSVGLENIVAAKGPAELMEAVTERLEENPVTIVILKQQVNAF